jgi:hypothetical protein
MLLLVQALLWAADIDSLCCTVWASPELHMSTCVMMCSVCEEAWPTYRLEDHTELCAVLQQVCAHADLHSACLTAACWSVVELLELQAQVASIGLVTSQPHNA